MVKPVSLLELSDQFRITVRLLPFPFGLFTAVKLLGRTGTGGTTMLVVLE